MCGGGPKTVTSTTSSQPPEYLAGPLQTAANAAVRDFQGSSYQPYNVPNVNLGGNLYGDTLGKYLPDGVRDAFNEMGGRNPFTSGPPGVTGQNQSNLQPLDTSGNDLISQSRALTSGSLGGAFLHPESNPYLASTFNRAADLTRTRLDSEFAGSGRNLGAARPARSEELQTLMSNIFGQNYQAERDRQIQALVSAQELDPINLLINRLAGITPGAGGKTTSTQPIFKTGLF